MAPGRRRGSGRPPAAQQQWKVGDLVLAKVKGFPAWPAMVSEPEKWGFSSDRKKLFVCFYGTQEIAFCNYTDVEAFTEEKKKSLLTKRQGKGAYFVRAVNEIVGIYEKLRNQNHDKFNSGDECTVSSDGNLEGSKCKYFDRSPEVSHHITGSHHSEALCASTESCDVFNPEEIPATLVGGDLQDASTEMKELNETISILNQLRQTPLVTVANSRKRIRDAPLQSFTIPRRVTSVRRSRTAGYQHKFQKSTMLFDDTNPAGDDLITDSVHEESALKEKSIVNVSHTSVSIGAVMPGSVGLPFNGTCEDILSGTASLKSKVTNLNDGSMLDSTYKLEHPGKEYSEVDRLNVDIRLNDKLDLPIKTLILKKKRKPNRKRVTRTTECAKLYQEADLQVQQDRGLLESPNSCNDTSERFCSEYGDDHLPLVKRARVRMSKPLVEETRLDEVVGTEERSDTIVLIDNSDKDIISSSPGTSCPASGTSLSVNEALSSVVNDHTHSSGRDLLFWKANQLKGISLDVEVALPPFKRRLRALEAMSANAAEATDDCTKVPRAMELIYNDCMDSPKTTPLRFAIDGITRSPAKPETSQLSDSNAFHGSESILPSCLTSQNLEVSTITSSESKPDATHTGNCDSYREDCCKILMDAGDCDGPSISKMADKDILDNIIQPCSLNFIEKQKKCDLK